MKTNTDNLKLQPVHANPRVAQLYSRKIELKHQLEAVLEKRATPRPTSRNADLSVEALINGGDASAGFLEADSLYAEKSAHEERTLRAAIAALESREAQARSEARQEQATKPAVKAACAASQTSLIAKAAGFLKAMIEAEKLHDELDRCDIAGAVPWFGFNPTAKENVLTYFNDLLEASSLSQAERFQVKGMIGLPMPQVPPSKPTQAVKELATAMAENVELILE